MSFPPTGERSQGRKRKGKGKGKGRVATVTRVGNISPHHILSLSPRKLTRRN